MLVACCLLSSIAGPLHNVDFINTTCRQVLCLVCVFITIFLDMFVGKIITLTPCLSSLFVGDLLCSFTCQHLLLDGGYSSLTSLHLWVGKSLYFLAHQPSLFVGDGYICSREKWYCYIQCQLSSCELLCA